MIDHTDNDLRAAAKSLRDVVAPALGSGNPLARQQLHLVIEWLDFYRSRLPYVHERQALELTVQVETARRVVAAAPEAAALRAALDDARTVLEQLGPAPSRLQSATGRLEEELAAVVREAARFEPAARHTIERAVIEDTRRLLDVQRAWFLPQSIESDPLRLPPLEAALRGEPLKAQQR